MKLQNISDILKAATPPQLQQAPSPVIDALPEVYPDGFFEEEDAETYDEQAQDPTFQDNLADGMSESYLDQLASEFRGEIDDDETDRAPWMEMVSNVQEQIGVGDNSNYEEPFPGCSTVVFPLFVKAQIQFTSRAMPEIFPNNPVKGVILGDDDPILEAQSERVADTMNYQYQYQDPDNKKDFARMLTWLPYVGSGFRYVSHDPLKNRNIVRYIPAGDLIVAYNTTSLSSAYRITHRFTESRNDILKLQNIGFYREVDLFDTNGSKSSYGSDSMSDNAVAKLRDAADGSLPDSDNANDGQNQCLYNVYTYRDLEGFEDTDDSGNLTGIALPYVFTMHESTGKILAIRRNWKEDDEYKTQRVYFAHYKYHEGLGFYGAGLPHLLGSIQTAITGALRAFGDSMGFSLLQGGFKLKSAKISGDQTMKPGQYLDVDCDIEDIAKAIKPLNFQSPSGIVIQYIELLTKVAEEIISIGDLMTGDEPTQNSPVGTTLAMIEQAQKVISAQHKSLYESMSEEFRIMYDLNFDFLPDNDQFVIPGKSGLIQRADFDGKVAVIPTADPSVSSFQQRQAIDQATMQLFSIPEFKPYAKDGGYPLLLRMLKNMNVPDIDAIVISEQQFMQLQQQQQQNPQPNPDIIKAQAMQTDAQTRAQAAQAKAQSDQANAQNAAAQHSLDSKSQQFEQAIETQKLQLQEKTIDMDYATNDKMIDARFLGTVAPALQQSSDALAMQNISHEQDKALQQQQQQHALQIQHLAAQHAQTQAAMQPQSVENGAPTSPPPMPSQTPVPQPIPQPMQTQTPTPAMNPVKQGMLMRLMNKIRGR